MSDCNCNPEPEPEHEPEPEPEHEPEPEPEPIENCICDNYNNTEIIKPRFWNRYQYSKENYCLSCRCIDKNKEDCNDCITQEQLNMARKIYVLHNKSTTNTLTKKEMYSTLVKKSLSNPLFFDKNNNVQALYINNLKSKYNLIANKNCTTFASQCDVPGNKHFAFKYNKNIPVIKNTLQFGTFSSISLKLNSNRKWQKGLKGHPRGKKGSKI